MLSSSTRGRSGESPGRPVARNATQVLVVLPFVVLLMGFSICEALLDQPAMAAASGVAAVGLAGEAARRALRGQASRQTPRG